MPIASIVPSARLAGLRGGVLCALAMFTAPLRVDAQQAATGTVEGRVEVSRKLTSRRPRFRIYAEPGARAAAPAEEQAPDERSNIVIYVEGVPARPQAAGVRSATIRQRSERFLPHVLPVMRGTTVAFPNEDRLYHNVFSLSSAKTFDLGRFPRGHSRAVTFEQPGVVQVFCHIHSDMSAVVLVVDTPHYAVPGADGRYSIPDLPPGDYTLVAFHERIEPIRHALHVAPGSRVTVDFRIPLPAAEAARGR